MTPPTPPPLPPPPPECMGAITTVVNVDNGEAAATHLPPPLPPPENKKSKKHKSSSDYQEKASKHIWREAIYVVSHLYAKLLLVASGVLLVTEVLKNKIPLLFFHGYMFTYLYGGGIICLMSIYISMMVDKCPKLTGDDGDGRKRSKSKPDISVFLRMGTLLFGLGSLISNGLEISTVFTLDRVCTDEVNMAQPILQVLFTFLQMHFFFLNSQDSIRSLGWFRNIALMHLVAVNLSTWVRLVTWETTSEWLNVTHVMHNMSQRWPPKGFNVTAHAINDIGEHKSFFTANCLWKVVDDRMEDFLGLQKCLHNSTIGAIGTMALPYLSPFIVQYSFIAAAISYVLWHNANCRNSKKHHSAECEKDKSEEGRKESRRRMDCQGSSKGLFLGLLVLVGGIIIMILFFVLTNDHGLHFDTLFAVVTMHSAVLGTSVVATLLGLCQIQSLRYRYRRGRTLDDLIQGCAVMAVYAYGITGLVVGGTELPNVQNMVLFIDGALTIIHACIQTLFNRQAMDRSCESRTTRPGRQVVMYLVFTNMVLWLVESFTVQNHTASQLQVKFYGSFVWGIFARIAVPIMALFRFHSAVVLMDVWRKCYRT